MCFVLTFNVVLEICRVAKSVGIVQGTMDSLRVKLVEFDLFLSSLLNTVSASPRGKLAFIGTLKDSAMAAATDSEPSHIIAL